MDATTLLRALADDAPGAPLDRLAALALDVVLERPMAEVLPRDVATRLARRALAGWLESPSALPAVRRLVDAVVERLAHDGRALRDVVPHDVRHAVRDVVGRPVCPDRRLVLTVLDREPTRELVRALLLDTVLQFGRTLATPVAGMARGLGSLARFATETVRSYSGGLGTLVGAVSDEVERQLEKRAVEFVDVALAGVFAQIADALSDPRRVTEAAELRLAILDGALELSLHDVARELRRADVTGAVEAVRAGLGRWLASAGSDAQIEAVAAFLLERDGGRSLGAVLDELGLLDATGALGRDLLRARMRDVVAAPAFAAWLAGLEREASTTPMLPAVAPAASGAAADVLDDALDVLHRHAPEYGGGLTDHGPMVVEALCALGRVDAVPAWLADYVPRLDPAPPDGTPLGDAACDAAVGHAERYPDLVASFRRTIQTDGWQATLARWVPRLAPGLVGAAAHGIIRAGHAVRAIALRDSPARREELARGLAYWAATWTALPGGDRAAHTSGRRRSSRAPDAGEASRAPGTARTPTGVLPRLERMPASLRAGAIFLTDALAGLDRFPPFAATIDAVDVGDDVDAFLSDLSRGAARLSLANAGGTPLPLIATVHAVTCVAAARVIAARLEAPEARAALARHAWHAVAAFAVALAEAAPASPAAVATAASAAGAPEVLLERALAAGDEHAIKLLEACAREHAVAPDPAYVAAAAAGVDALARLRQPS